MKNNRAIFLISKVEGRNVSYLAWIATPRPTITTDSPRIEADWRWRPIWNLVDIPEITFHRCRCGNGDAGRDRLDFGSRPCGISQGSRHARRVALSLYLYFGKRGKREKSTLFSITELIYHFDLSDTVIVGSFSKKEEKRYRELDKRCSSFSDERWYLSRIIFKCKYFSQVGKPLSLVLREMKIVPTEWKNSQFSKSVQGRRKGVSIFGFKFEFLFSLLFFPPDRISIKPISLSATRLNLIRRAIYFNEQSNAIVNSRLLHGPRPSRSVVLKSPTLVFPRPTLLPLFPFFFFPLT